METIRVAPWISWVPEATRLVLFDDRDASYHVLNESASHIWRLLAAGGDSRQAARSIAAEHGLPSEEAAAAVEEFAASALAKGLLVAD